MASTVGKKSCVKCPKGPGQVCCDGCEQHFCMKHLREHRAELSEQMDDLTSEHDQLQQHLMRDTADHPSPLMTRVDQWESKSIQKIQQVAAEVRSQLTELLAQTKQNIGESLRQIATELQENRQMETFTETELNKWMNQLKELRQELEIPSTIDVMNDENAKSSRHILLIRLRVLEQMKGNGVEY